ncbi:hypothetical protein EDD21DRAFT_358041 [Dissophora ornata]|nr:hypothetical protein EDD21DRAFT_358041 [Dissophora ornata]
MKFTLSAICILLTVATAARAAPIAVDSSKSELPPCPENWNPIIGRGFACQPIDKRSEVDLIPCPKDWNPKFGHGLRCKPVVKRDEDVEPSPSPSQGDDGDNSA